jgi:mannitol-specific phosphotransferase system IIBC component
MSNPNPVNPLNRRALISFIFGLLAIISFCIGFAPFLPLTSIICYPASILFCIVAVSMGLTALQQIRWNAEGGRMLALIGAWMGGLSFIAVLCMVALGIMLWPYLVDFIQQAWNKVRP